MTYKQVVAHYRGLSKAAQALGIKRQNVYAWSRRRRIPSRWQMRLEADTGGGLKADARAHAEIVEIASYLARRSA